ncbi:MAG: SOS response-associated peptidase family protein [Legionella sp.]|nr:SOS response-associated peptidase family protein [Legionella sp.]
MCGRFSLTASEQELYAQFHLITMPTWAPRYNIAPTQEVLVVRQTPEGLRAESMRWGLALHITATPTRPVVHINARAETAAIKPTFREAFRTRRGLILMA